MTLKQAIKLAKAKPVNENLYYCVGKWNDGYIIHSSTYMKRHPKTEIFYSTKNK